MAEATMKRMKSIRFNKKRGTIKQPVPNENSPSGVKWARNPDALSAVLSEVQQELSPSQISSISSTIASAEAAKNESESNSPRLRKNPARSTNKANTKSTRFFKLPTRAKAPDKAHFQQIDLREIEVCQQIGRGASSAGVFLCLVDGWACAMKQLKREHVGAIDIRCFEREMDILYQLPPHPSIVRYLFHTSMGTDLCLFMQLYGGTLREHLDERRKTNRLLSPDKIAQIALESARGIQFLHQHGVIHRDIKAGNCFITKNEEGEVTRIAIGDFDTSLRISASLRNIKDNNADMIIRDEEDNAPVNNQQARGLNTAEKRNYFAQNRPKSTVGTAGFMAPEVLRSRGSTPYGFKADIYSFGMLLYEMLTLKLPYETMDTVDIIDAVLEGTQVEDMKIDSIIRDKYRSLVDLYQHCTTMNPEERPSISQIIKTLTPMVEQGDFTLRVERKLSLIEQLNKFNSSAPRPPSVRERDIQLEFDGLSKEMEEDIARVTAGPAVPTTVKFGGPQVSTGADSARTRLPVPLGIGASRDAIITHEESETETETDRPDSARGKSGLMSTFKKKKTTTKARPEKKKHKRSKLTRGLSRIGNLGSADVHVETEDSNN